MTDHAQRYLYDFQTDHDEMTAEVRDALVAKMSEHPQVLAVSVDPIGPELTAFEILIAYTDPDSPYDVVEPVQNILDAAGLDTYSRGGGQVDPSVNSFADMEAGA